MAGLKIRLTTHANRLIRKRTTSEIKVKVFSVDMDFSDEFCYPLTPENSEFDAIESLLNKTNFTESAEMPEWMTRDISFVCDSESENDEVFLNSPIPNDSTPPSPFETLENPLSPPGNAYELNDTELRDLPVRKLNEYLRKLPKEKAKTLRKKRRSLKNRSYAQDCRARRVQLKNDLENRVKRLIKELSRMRKELEETKKERDHYKALLQTK